MTAQAQTLLEVQALRQPDWDADDDDAPGESFVDLQNALSNLIKSKNERTVQKQTKILQEVQAAFVERKQQVEAGVSKDVKDAQTLSKTKYNKISTQLEAKFAEMQALNQRYQQDLQARWQEYNEIYNQVDPCKLELQAGLEKRKAATKRKIAALQQESEAMLVEAEAKIAKLKKQAKMFPELAKAIEAAM